MNCPVINNIIANRIKLDIIFGASKAVNNITLNEILKPADTKNTPAHLVIKSIVLLIILSPCVQPCVRL